MDITLHEVARVVGAKNNWSVWEDVSFNAIEFDSRKIEAGDLFLPLKGARDGHEFIPKAFEQGCLVTLSERELTDVPYLWVEDCLQAFQQLAAYYVKKTGVDVIAVTGSNGKTTTKDMIAHLLATTYRTYKTQGNYNNEIGLPYTILHMPKGTEKLVLEMGQDHLGDIHLLSMLAQPRIGVVTLVGEAHLAFFASRAQIAEGKLQIADGMPSDGLLLVPEDDLVRPYLPKAGQVVTFGEGTDLQVLDLVVAKDALTFQLPFLNQPLHLPITGKYNATNAMLASYVAKHCGVAEDRIVAAFSNLTLTGNRTEWKKAANGADILSDVYNANPTAMRLILETFSSLPRNNGGRKIAVLADMKELGSSSLALHRQIINSLSPEWLDIVICYGDDIAPLAELARQIFPAGRVYYFKKTAELDQFEALLLTIRDLLQPDDQILFKGSHSMNLVNLVEALEEA